MGRIRMYVYIDNQSGASLTLTGSEIESGDFTPDWNPPEVIPTGQRLGFQGEGDLTLVPTTGTEGRVRYNIDAPDGGELYIHWNSPLVESPYDNTFHVWAPANWEVTHWGGQGHEAQLDIRLRRTERRTVPNFDPRGRGFAFSNSWDPDLPVITVGYLWNRLFESLPGPLSELGIQKVLDENFLPLTRADAGMCGGMTYAVMDYYAAHQLPPDQMAAPASRDDELFQYLRDRLWDSFDVTGQGHRFLGYSSPTYPNGDEGVLQAVGLTRGRSWITYREAFPEIQQDIDAGRLSPLGLIHTDELDIGKNHQVLAYGYQKSGQDVTLFITDPNAAQQEVTLQFNITATDGEVHANRYIIQSDGKPRLADEHRIFCIFRLNGYQSKTPPRGRPITRSLRDALRATTRTTAPGQYSLRTAMQGKGTGGSARRWASML